ncbi:MAG: ROK family protein [Candidatus Saccharimonadales bacterium]
MYAGVDIGGTKTLVATLDDTGIVTEKMKFPTPSKYSDFLNQLQETVNSLKIKDFKAGCIAVPGKIDRKRGIGKDFGNLAWHDVSIQADAELIFRCPIIIENDANLAALSESMLLPNDKKLLYVTISTGIGTGFIINQKIDPELQDSEGGQMPLEYNNKVMAWEDFASGSAIVKRYGKKASEITEEQIWRRISHDLAEGLLELIAITQPDIIIIGGSVGRYFERYKVFLLESLKKYENPLVRIPVLQEAARPEEAVIYGCFDLTNERYGTNN